MSSQIETRTLETQDDLTRSGLTGVTAEIDQSNTCYLTGKVDTVDDEAEAVAIAIAHGAALVCDGVEAPDEAMPEMERFRAASVQPHHEDRIKTPAERILGAADLSGRVFDSSHANHSNLQTGNAGTIK